MTDFEAQHARIGSPRINPFGIFDAPPSMRQPWKGGPIIDRQSLIAQFEILLPLAADWASEQEKRILREGVPLSGQEMSDAVAIGVREPQRVRLLRVEAVPMPTHPQLRAAAEAIHFLGPETRGLTLHYGILVRWDCWRERPLIAHELVHAAQYERLGGMMSFLRQYLLQCLTIGYANAPMELEAAEVADRVCPR
jgi:hypothetical protein